MTLIVDEQLQELNRSIKLTLRPRCGLCRKYPGNGQYCKERGKSVHPTKKPGRGCYDPMMADEFLSSRTAKLKAWHEANREKVLAGQRAWREAHKDENAAKRKARRTRAKQALNVLEKLRTTDPELYEKLLKETSK